MEYECHCGKNYLIVDPLCQKEVIEKIEVAVEAAIVAGNKAEENLALISSVLSSVSSITNYVPDFGENYVSSLTMDVPIDCKDIPYFLDNPVLRDAFQHFQPASQTPSCSRCEFIDFRISVILSFGFFLIGLRRYRETELIRKIIYLLCPFRRKHPEILGLYNQIWRLTLEQKLCSSLFDHLVIFHCQPIEELLESLLKSLESHEIDITTLPSEQPYQDLTRSARKSRRILNVVTENIVEKFLVSRKLILRDFLTHFVEHLRNTVIPTNFLKLFSDVLHPFVAFVVESYGDDSFLQQELHPHIESLRARDYRKFIELGLSHKKYHYLTNNLIMESME